MKEVNYTIPWNLKFFSLNHLVQHDSITFDVIMLLNGQYPLFFKEILLQFRLSCINQQKSKKNPIVGNNGHSNR